MNVEIWNLQIKLTDGDGTENHLVLRDFHPLGLTGMHNMKVIPSPR